MWTQNEDYPEKVFCLFNMDLSRRIVCRPLIEDNKEINHFNLIQYVQLTLSLLCILVYSTYTLITIRGDG